MPIRWEDIPENRQLVDDIKRQLARGLGYTRAVARVFLERQAADPDFTPPHRNTLRRAEQQARQERAWEGRQRANATRQANLERSRETVRQAAGERIPPENPTVIIYQNPSTQTGETPYRRLDVQFRDRRTDENRSLTIFTPIVGTLTPTAIRGFIFAAILQSENREISSDEQMLWRSLQLTPETQINLI